MEEEVKEYHMFGPTNEKDLRRQYPELLSIEEFKKLSVSELLFVWWYANPTSPLVRDENIADKFRAVEAFKKAFKKNLDEQRKTDYYSLNFPDKVKLAVDRMMNYSPTARIKSKMIIEEIFDNYQKMVKVDMSEFVTVEIGDDGKESKTINWAGRNSYINSTAKISETLPQLIRQLEEGFGITESKGEEGGTKAIHRFHSAHKEE